MGGQGRPGFALVFFIEDVMVILKLLVLLLKIRALLCLLSGQTTKGSALR
jgi:hypothetical protein